MDDALGQSFSTSGVPFLFSIGIRLASLPRWALLLPVFEEVQSNSFKIQLAYIQDKIKLRFFVLIFYKKVPKGKQQISSEIDISYCRFKLHSLDSLSAFY
ncbi:MAG TPA: hypothetical protein DCY91_19520 [Cyanobacteria bacterium UBA11370]|nr:hypothetical protein [Cyanobacteria bacterium UBA11370]HBY77810.1 hypothetical protein [Cyanobacteria bacterium UBA11148]